MRLPVLPASKGKTLKRRNVLLLSSIAFSSFLVGAGVDASAAPPPTEATLIDRLIGNVAQMSSVVFIRNGSEASAPDAAAHLRDKYDYFRDEIVTADDFIRLCGTRSEMTRIAYRVRLTGGQEKPAAEFLREQLQMLRGASR